MSHIFEINFQGNKKLIGIDAPPKLLAPHTPVKSNISLKHVFNSFSNLLLGLFVCLRRYFRSCTMVESLLGQNQVVN